MLGTVTDAEDMVHDTFLTLEKIRTEKIKNIRAYLCKVITNRCLDYLKSANQQREVYVGPWLPEPLVFRDEETNPLDSLVNADYISIAYLTIMQKLSGVERAVFILREVLDLDYKEIADIVEKTETNCRKIFSRAKQKIAAEAPDPVINYDADKQLLMEFVRAVNLEDKQNLLQLLSEDVTLYSDGGGKVSAAIRPVVSSHRVIMFLLGVKRQTPVEFHFSIENINGIPGIVNYVGDKVHSVISYKVLNNQIKEIYIIMNPDKLNHI
ncbi:RNA polymerase sigma factor SigJ [Caldalkalibacillus uzonensis]|uniref:RNA polymerase sigma factor SigJ n=1 Tax=Caldalkalibacillus uzonensis TaxID=353224 RepID=UPI0027D85332|nr:RNA polymerase sigma factor SigJ [Caldalkalibacillus uzonensis]